MKNSHRSLFLAAGVLLAFAPFAQADEFALKLKPGPGGELTQAACSACHSIDYVVMNSPFQSQKSWDGEVHKMIRIFGADISDTDAKTIIDYLSKNYGS